MDYINEHKPDLIFFDNVKDCLRNINDWAEVDKVLNTFTQQADEYGTHICFTLHENPSKDDNKGRGAIGTELQNKCETIFKLDKDGDLTKVIGLFTRTQEFDELLFRITEKGLPVLLSDFDKKEIEIQNRIEPF